MSSSGESLGRELTLLDGDWTPPPGVARTFRDDAVCNPFAIRSAAKPGDVGGRDAGLSPTQLKVLRGY
jgi:hypothetical protein